MAINYAQDLRAGKNADQVSGFSERDALRPSQIRASAAETALMIPGAFAQQKKYTSLNMPIVIIAGEQDRLIDIETQSARLHRE